MAIYSQIELGRSFAADNILLSFTVYQYGTATVQTITGWTMTWVLAATEGGAAVLTKTPTIVSGTGGTCSVQLTSANTSTLSTATYYWYLKRTDSGSEKTLAWGTMAFKDLVA